MFLITGIPASGKSTVARELAGRLPRSAHVSGDVFRRMVVGGRTEMSPEGDQEALRQLRLRHEIAAATADAYATAGFVPVLQDVILGDELARTISMIRTRPLHVVVLAPSAHAVAEREAARPKTAYGVWTPEELDRSLRQGTPRFGLWLDTTELTPAETVDEILRHAGSGAE
jgi:cytidylate kinase